MQPSSNKVKVDRDWADDVPVADLPSISMVIPCFRSGPTLERTLLSLEAQKYDNLQIIVMDGGSQDETVDVLKQYDHMIDYWESKPDEGQVDAINKGFRRANGELYGWLCADDALRPGALRRLAREFLRRPDADVITSGCRRVFDDNSEVLTRPEDDYFDSLFIKNTIEQPSTLWRGALHRAVGEISRDLRYAFDWELWCKFKHHGAVFHAIPSITSVYYFSDDNLTSTGGRKIADEMYKIVRKYGPGDGELADAFMYLYKSFDLKGYFDPENMGYRSRILFRMMHKYLRSKYGEKEILLYNWNFASRQERGLGWSERTAKPEAAEA